ncbi:hypothetical protein [Pectinatus frisingensis]|jgi:dTDP-glucose pyrophosphorylase|uniref:hypothetical protein n=2 Tax=Pectinatus frisingensis TaxID=865 RepID=UPI001E5F79F5|nr:hypothetical protein [Pectinatus frisingensis]
MGCFFMQLCTAHGTRRVSSHVSGAAKLKVVVVDIAEDCMYQLLATGKLVTVIHFIFQDSPESFYQAVVGAMNYSGHACVIL